MGNPASAPKHPTPRTPTLQDTFGQYVRATGMGNEAKALAAHDKYGLNSFEVPVPPFLSMLKDHLVAPFFCFQVTGPAGH